MYKDIEIPSFHGLVPFRGTKAADEATGNTLPVHIRVIGTAQQVVNGAVKVVGDTF